MTVKQRPYQLQVFEFGQWKAWSTYVQQENADTRARMLGDKGHGTQVVNTDTGELLSNYGPESNAPKLEECLIYCGEWHLPPFDGQCLL